MFSEPISGECTHEFTRKDHHKEIKIRLYTAGVFTLKHQFVRPKRSTGLPAASRIGSWSVMDGTIVLTKGMRIP